MESAFIDGASHFQTFWRLIMPLSIPALAAFAIFQFLWVWNDYLVALIFIGTKPDTQVVTSASPRSSGRGVTTGTCSPPVRSSRCCCRCWCSSRSSATSSAGCWPAP